MTTRIDTLAARLVAGLLLLGSLCGAVVASDSALTEQVRISLLPERAAVPGDTLWLGLSFQLLPHWHV